MYQSESVRDVRQLNARMSLVEMFDAAQDLMRAGKLTRRHSINCVSGMLAYDGLDGKSVVEIDIARGFVQPYNDRLEDVYRPIGFRLHTESI